MTPNSLVAGTLCPSANASASMSTICTTWFRRIADMAPRRSARYSAYSPVSAKVRRSRANRSSDGYRGAMRSPATTIPPELDPEGIAEERDETAAPRSSKGGGGATSRAESMPAATPRGASGGRDDDAPLVRAAASSPRCHSSRGESAALGRARGSRPPGDGGYSASGAVSTEGGGSVFALAAFARAFSSAAAA